MNTSVPVAFGKRESQKQKVRQRLLDEGLRLFSKQGLEKTTVADIVASCKIARGTFYNYFSDVHTLFDAIIDQINGNIQAVIETNRTKDMSVYDYLYTTFKTYFDCISTPEMIRFHVINQAHIRQSSYQSDTIKNIVLGLNRDLKARHQLQDFKEKYEFLLLSFMLVGAPPELFLATHTTANIDLKSDQLAIFLTKVFHKVLMK